MASLEFRGVTKRISQAILVSPWDLEVADGEFLVIVGPSGCGKSTTLNMIAGLEQVSEGNIFIGGRNVTRLSPRERNIAMVFQSYALYPNMTVARNISFSLRLARTPTAEINRRVKEVANLLEIEPLLDRKPRALSGGQRQRVALGRALIRRADLYLFDEPLSNLDAQLRGHMRIEIKRLHQSLGATIVYVTHDQVEAMTLATRIVVMDRGIVEQVGTPEEIYSSPASRSVAGFIGSPTMNFVQAEVISCGSEHGAFLKTRSFQFPIDEIWPVGRMPKGAVTLGLRGEDIALTTIAEADAVATVGVTESLGREMIVEANFDGGDRLLFLASPNACWTGQRIGVRLNRDRLHLFEPEEKGGRRISRAS